MNVPPQHDGGGCAQILDPRVRARADEDAVDPDFLDRRTGLERHVCERPLGGRPRVGIVEVAGIGHDAVDRDDHPGIRAPGDLRADLGDVDLELAVEHRVGIRRQPAPALDGCVPVLRRTRAPAEVLERRLVRRDQPGACARLDRHVADREASLHRKPLDHRARVLDHVADAAVDAELADRIQDDVLRADAFR